MARRKADSKSKRAPPEEEPTILRETFGPSPATWMEIEVASDQQVRLKGLTFGGAAELTAGDVSRALAETFGVVHGLIEEAIQQVAEKAAEAPDSVVRGQIIARGTEPVAGESGRIDFTYQETLEGKVSHAGLIKALGSKDLAEVTEAAILTCLVAPGQELAVLVAAGQGTPGTDVMGNEIPEVTVAAVLDAVSHVRVEGERFLAETYGYVCVSRDVISVIPPIWVSGDGMEAHFIHLAQAGPGLQPTTTLLESALAAGGVRYGIDEDAVKALAGLGYESDQVFTHRLARGTAAVDGVDSHVKFNFDPGKKGGTIQEDGSIDLRERNAAVGVVKDQLLGEMVPATPGRAGSTVAGVELEAAEGSEIEFAAGDNVRSEKEGESLKFYAEMDGNVDVADGVVAVNQVLDVSGDVNYETGNLDVQGDIAIKGSVATGFTVRASGSITIGGMIESGAQVHAGGGALVVKGIVGESTVVEAEGDVETKFIQNSTVTAGGNLTVGSYIHNANVRVGGQIEVHAGGGDHGGSIVGGEVYATEGITAAIIGSDSSEKTAVGIGPKPKVAAEIDVLQETIDFYETNIQRIRLALGLKRSDDERLKTVVEEAPRQKRKAVASLAAKLKELNAGWKQSFAEQRGLKSEHERELKAATIAASGAVHQGVEVCMGGECMRLTDTVAAAAFTMVDGRITLEEPAPE